MVVGDFGSAVIVSSSVGPCATVIWGAPETLCMHKAEMSADIFSYGMILWFLLNGTGEVPTLGTANRYLATTKDSPWYGSFRPSTRSEWNHEWVALLKRCWIANPINRPTASDVLNSIHQITKHPVTR